MPDPSPPAGVASPPRADANRLALRAVRSVFAAAVGGELLLFGTPVHVEVAPRPPAPWPIAVPGLDADADGPWPAPLRVDCRWDGGSTALLLEADAPPAAAAAQQLVGLRATLEATDALLVAVHVARALLRASDGALVPVPAACALPSDAPAPLRRALKDVVVRSGLSAPTPTRVVLGAVAVPSGDVVEPAEIFRELVRVALLKLPFVVEPGERGIDGIPPYDVRFPPAPADAAPPATARLAELSALPGGVRRQRETLDGLLAWLAGAPDARRLEADLGARLRERFDAADGTTGPVLRLLAGLGFARVDPDGGVVLTAAGVAYRAAPSPEALFDALDAAHEGLLAALAVIAERGPCPPGVLHAGLVDLLDEDWPRDQSSRRANWLVSLGLTERGPEGDGITPAGAAVLERHHDGHVWRRHVAEIDVANADARRGDETDAWPPNADADRLELTPALLRPHLRGLRLPDATLDQACAALSTGRHLLLVGPPGTGKTALALALARTARAEGYAREPVVATASAAWTRADVVGDYAPGVDGASRFRPGLFLRAVERRAWLVVDEINRADVDRAFGELLAVLAGHDAETPFEGPDGEPLRVGTAPGSSHRVAPTFRVLATLNAWDRRTLFPLSFAVQRRFAVVPVDVPDDAAYAALLADHAGREGPDPALDAATIPRLRLLFSHAGLLAHRAVGPAVLADVVRYLRRRAAGGDGLAEALVMHVLPQLEGLAAGPSGRAREALLEALLGHASSEAVERFARRWDELGLAGG